MITLTEKAAIKIKEIAEAEGLAPSVRVKVIGGGCAGYTNDLSFDEQVSELDELTEFDGVKIIADPLSLQYLEETTIDFLDSPFGAGFKFINPNVKGSCGCGNSVSY